MLSPNSSRHEYHPSKMDVHLKSRWWEPNRGGLSPRGNVIEIESPQTGLSTPILPSPQLSPYAILLLLLPFLRIFCLFVPHTLNTTERCLPCFIPLGIVVVKAGPVPREQKEKKAFEGERIMVLFSFLLLESVIFRGKKYFFSEGETQKEKLNLFLPSFTLLG